VSSSKSKAGFIEPMLLLRTDRLPQGPEQSYELKLDGYRALAIKTGGRVKLRSRNDNDFNGRYRAIVNALSTMPDETVIDGELVALDENGRPSFNLLQNYGSAGAPLIYYVFEVLFLSGRNVMSEPLARRKEMLRHGVLAQLGGSIREPVLDASLRDLRTAVRAQGLEGLVAKRLDSAYEPGKRSGAWQKMRLNQGQEFVIGGYTPSPKNFDALIFGYYEGSDLMYVARTRNGFTPASRELLFRKLRVLEISECPFVNLPEAHAGRWGQGLTAEKMKECRWLRPQLVANFEFVEWTPDGHLRHSKFIRLRDDKNPREVHRES
jgi:bifunctional non-homologous end joining protein LigD